MSDYGTMIARISDEMARPELVARIPATILSAIRYFEGERLWFKEGESTAETIVGQANYALPSDFVEPDTLTLTETAENYRKTLKRRPWPWMRGNQVHITTTSRPSDWSYYADQIWLYPTPDKVYILTMSFLQRLDALVEYADTNGWMTHGEELIRVKTKKDLYLFEPANLPMAQAMGLLERESLKNLRQKSESKISSGTMSYDPALSGGRSGYNINFG
jgi:hypothetical protein